MSITQRIDAVTKIGPKYLGTILPAPRSVKWELNTACNYSCSFCVRNIRKNENKVVDRAFYSRVVRELKGAGVEELGLFYINEPFSVKWLPEAIAEAKAVGFEYIFLTTNGSIANPDIVERCMAAGLDSLKFSINFYDDAQFKEVAQVKPKLYATAIANLKKAREIRALGQYKTKIYASSIAFDGDQGEKMRAIVDDIKPHVDEFYWLPLYGMGGAAKEAGWKPQPGNPGRLAAMRDPLPCWSVFTEGHITADGKLSACCFGHGVDDDMVMGDLNTQSFMEAWNSRSYQDLRRAHLAKDVTGTPCETCAAA
ncbi:MAG: SPASM domain-containing protein [Betaproteobacteria bacterium]|nr:SPASM domain-containing protein [Betaproteobacteria bacterium]